MLSLFNVRNALKDSAGLVAEALQRDQVHRLVVRSPIGAGRHTLANNLETRLHAHVVEFPSYDDLDSPLHGLIQLASATGTLAEFDGERGTPREQAFAAARFLAEEGRPLVLLIPAPLSHPNDIREATRAEIDELIRQLGSIAKLKIILLSTTSHEDTWFDRSTKLLLTTTMVSGNDIDPQQLPDRFAHAASKLRTWMQSHGTACSPIEARLQVGLIALGDGPDALGLPLEALARRMADQLARRFTTLGTAVRRLLIARHPLPEATVATLTGIDHEWLPLLTSCIGYGDGAVRVSEITRQVLLNALNASHEELEPAHQALAEHHASLDGATAVSGLSRVPAIHWLEKVHHLARGGDACAQEWARQQPAGREQVWERARILSKVKRRYADAADLFRSTIERFGLDTYSMHYLAYNLERARTSLAEVRAGYEYAVCEDHANPWWQQRWVRFLIAHGTLDEARQAWRAARVAVDPNGEEMRRSPWLALNLHGMVARRWLALGRLDDARDVLAEIPTYWLTQEAELRDLVRVLKSDEQGRRLGESVYPASAALEDRWIRPANLRQMRGGRRLLRWAPGRVMEATVDSVTVVLAPTPADAQQVTYDAASWKRMANEPAADAEGYFEIGHYEGGEAVVRATGEEPTDRWLADETDELSGWVRA